MVFAVGVGLYDADGKPIGGEVRLWDSATRRPVGTPLVQGGPPLSLAFSPEGRLLLKGGAVVSASEGKVRGEARLFDSQQCSPLGPVLEHAGAVRIVAFSPDGRTFVTGDTNRCCTQWLTATCLRLGPPAVQNGTVRSVAFSPDGRRYIRGSASNDPLVQIWEAAQGYAVGPPLYHSSPVTAPAARRRRPSFGMR